MTTVEICAACILIVSVMAMISILKTGRECYKSTGAVQDWVIDVPPVNRSDSANAQIVWQSEVPVYFVDPKTGMVLSGIFVGGNADRAVVKVKSSITAGPKYTIVVVKYADVFQKVKKEGIENG
ncbi:hypothetical protein [Phascolarctobacterium faecium]|uniref:hypothetical protein n=1 Tax=Phascolarctobacterium faecium TaxID=33025 RepID=UPI003AB7FA65